MEGLEGLEEGPDISLSRFHTLNHTPKRMDKTDEELEEKRERIRAAFPECVALADAFRAEFGEGVTIQYMNEGGRELGKRAPEGSAYTVELETVTPPPVPKRGAAKRRYKR